MSEHSREDLPTYNTMYEELGIDEADIAGIYE